MTAECVRCSMDNEELMLLDCSHQVCNLCMQKLYLECILNESFAMRHTASDPVLLPCPRCEEPTSIERDKGPNQLKRSEAKMNQMRCRCEECNKHQSELFCLKCNEYCCEECIKAAHRDHEMVALIQAPRIPNCFHGKRLEYYCKDDDVFLCIDCLESSPGTHVGHNYVSIVDKVDLIIEKNVLDDTMAKVLNIQQMQLTKTIQAVEHLDEEYLNACKSITNTLDDFIGIFQRRKQELLAEAQQDYGRRKVELDMKIRLGSGITERSQKLLQSIQEGVMFPGSRLKLWRNEESIKNLIEDMKWMTKSLESDSGEMDFFVEKKEQWMEELYHGLQTRALLLGVEPISLEQGAYYVLSTWLRSENQLQLRYKGSVDGMNPSQFHAHCDKCGPTITIIKTTSGSIFGGYTDIDWTSAHFFGDFVHSAFTFLFQLRSKLEFQPLKFELRPDVPYAVCSSSASGPIFGQDLVISGDNFCESYSRLGRFFKISEVERPHDSPLSGEESWVVDDIEVYKVLFDESNLEGLSTEVSPHEEIV